MGKKKVLVEGRTKKERIEQRKKLGTLQSLTIQPATKKRYDIALNRFLDFLKDEGIAIPTKKANMDDVAAEYLEHLWSSKGGL